jgi:asparagine synthase (glutamine-hydrolysing)
MSAIAGLLRFDGRPVRRYEMERAANVLRQYGPDQSDVFADANIGLVHALMRMTPEDRFDRQPCTGASSALIVADVRLDNRDEIISGAGVSRAQAAAWSDSRVLLAAWEKFGDDVWPLLRGPFAAAIWDPRTRALTLARDHLGLNTLMWHQSASFFAFASMPNGLFAFEDVPRELNEEKFADFMVLNHAVHETTIYRKIFRVPPTHVMHVPAQGTVRQHRYWSPADSKAIRFASDEAYADGLRDRLDAAVRRQMRGAHPVGVLLSGGLDSSSVAALAAGALAEKNQRLAAFTGVPRQGFTGQLAAGQYADETPYVEEIRKAIPNIDVNYVRNDAGDDFAELERVFIAVGGPVRNPTNLEWTLKLLRLAHAQGRRILLGGFFGNCTISWNGWSQAASHLMRGRMLTAYRQWRLFYKCTPYSQWVAFRKLFLEPLLPERLGVWADQRRRPGRIAPWQDHAAIDPGFAAAMGVDSRARKTGHDFLYRMRRDERLRALAEVDYAGDWRAGEKAITGVEIRDPTADIDVVSYCFGIPPEQFLVEGIDRSLIRRAMWGRLPDMVLTNRSNGVQAADWHERLELRRGALARQLAEISTSPLARRIIDLPRLERALTNWPTGGWQTAPVFQEYNLALTRGLAGGRFLRWLEANN